MKTRLHTAFRDACLLMAVLLVTSVTWGQVTLPGTSPYSENFNTTPGATGTAYPTGWSSYDNTTVDNAMTVGSATSTSGANYNYGSRIGILGSGSAFSPSSLVLRIANTTGKTGLKISYDIVKIREQARSNSFNLEVSTTSATTGFTAVTGGTYASGTIAEGTTTAYTDISLASVDNTSGNVWIRWSYGEISGTGSRDGIALDNVVLSWGAAAPTVNTAAANAISATSAKLNGTIVANGTTTAASFNWGTTVSYGNSVAATPSSVTGTSSTAISATISGLTPNTQYNFRAVGTAGATVVNGTNANFYTLASVPGALTVGNPSISTLDVTVTATTQNGNPSATRFAIFEAGGNYVQANGSLGATAVWQTAAQWATVTVTGLTDNTTYTFSAKARNSAVTPVETFFGPTTAGTTLLNTFPTLTATALTGFGSVCLNTPSAAHSFTINGINLTSADVTVGPLAGYTFSTTLAGTYAASLAIPSTPTFTQDVYVIFNPSAAAAYNGNISVAGGGATAISVAVTGTGINTPSAVTTAAATGLTASTAEVDAEVTTEGCSAVTERGIVYSTTTNPIIGGTGVTKIADAAAGAGTFTVPVSGLTGGTIYYVKAYSTNNSGTNYGAELTFSTAGVPAPVATAATDITATGFTANWDASEGALEYRLDVSTSATFGTAAPATDLFFSEYVEGSASNKYLEIYNGTGAAVNLADYRVRLYSNGSTSATGTSNDVQLSGTLANGATIVLKNSAATVYTGTATTVASVNFNGDDAIALYKISTASNVDIFGRIGEDPGVAWTSGLNSTLDKTLVRKSFVTTGVTVNPTSGFPTLESEWTVYSQNDVTNLGAHTFAGLTPSYVAGYQDLAVTGTSYAVTGLASETTYYYRVRAVAGNTSDNSNTITVSTIVNTDPTLSATTLADFGPVCLNTPAGPNSFTVSGINLTAGDITVGPALGFSFSTTAGGTYTDTLTIPQTGTLSQEVFVTFEPTDAFPYNVDIEIAGGDASSVFAAATGEGFDTTPTEAIVDVTAVTATTADVNASISAQGCSAVIERGIVIGVAPDPEMGGTGVTTVTDAGTGAGTYTGAVGGLTAATVYYVRAYATNNGGTSYSASTSFTTAPVAAPLATPATDVANDNFTANWDPSEGATSYRLDVSTSSTFGAASPATDLFFSEYVEGSASNKYIEIYNGTGASVDLSNYRIRLYANGSTSATGSGNDVQLSGTLANGATVVLRNSAATVYTGTATVVASINFNGDDAIALYKISTSSNVDIFGRIGEDPGTAWTSATNSTVDKTLVRKPSVGGGITVNPTSGFPTLETEWTVFDQNDVTHLGAHTYAGSTPSFVTGYENLTVDGLSTVVTGLNPSTQYYYRVRAVAGNTSGNSNTITVTTTAASPRKMAANGTVAAQTANEVVVYKQDNRLSIHSNDTEIRSVVVYDMTGKVLFSSDKFNEQDVTLSNLSPSNQVLLVKVGTATSQMVAKKVVF